MAKDHPKNTSAVGAGWDQGLRGLWGSLWGGLGQRWPRRLSLRRPRMTRWRLAVLGGIAALVLLWSAVAAASTSIYTARVQVVDGGAVGIPPPIQNLDFGDVPRGASVERTILFENQGRIPTAVLLFEWGGPRDFMGIGDAFFLLDPGEEKKVRFEVSPPFSAESKTYSGRVIVLRVPWWWPW